MRRSIREGLVGLLVIGLAGCTGSIADNGSGSGGNSSGSGGNNGSGGSSNGSGGTSNGSGGSTGTGGTLGPGATCKTGIPSTSQVPRMTRLQYATVVNDLLGATLPPDTLVDDSTGSVTDIAWNGYQKAGDAIAAAVMANATSKAKFMTCDAAQATCLSDTIKAFGRKAFRRPLTDTEISTFMGFNSLTPKGTAAEVSEAILSAFLQSPSFIMLPELSADKDQTTGAFKLTSFEVATRLSFLFWNSIPDEALNTAADKNELQSKEQIVAQAQRLLMSPKATAVATTFHRAYAGVENGSHWLVGAMHDTTKYPAWATTYSDAMAEFDSFFQDILTSGGAFKDIFTSPTGFVTKSTAPIYGLAAADYTTTAKKTPLDATKRPGFLTRVAFLSTFSHDTPSPILRGAFITGRVLGIPTGTPDPKALATKPPAGDYKTNREVMQALTGPSPCNTCHEAKVNPPGFVLERYDAVGNWQDKDPLGGDINSTAEVQFDAAGTKKTVSTPAELMAELAKTPVAQRIYAERFVSYASGRTPNENDLCIVDQLAPNLNNATYTIRTMMADYTQADSFRLRTVGN